MLPRFEFAAAPVPTFTGFAFYNVYKDADFLRHDDHIVTILSKGHQLRRRTKDLQPGGRLLVDGMYVSRNKPIEIKKGGPNIRVEDHEFTYNRLTGLVAAYAFEHREKYPNLEISEATTLGLTWDNTNVEKARLYLASVSGTEHFYDQFSFYPLVCALRKMRLNKMPADMVVKIARVKNHNGERMVQLLQNEKKLTAKLWAMFPGSTKQDFARIVKAIDK